MAAYPRQNYAQDVSLPALMILFRGESERMDPELLDAVLSEFFRRGVPATVLMEGQPLTPGTPDGLQALMDEYAAREGGLLELAIPLGDVAGQLRYFQMRTAGALRDRIAGTLKKETTRQVTTLIDDWEQSGIDVAAFRSAGFRVLMRPGDGEFSAAFVGRGQLTISGGATLPLSGDPARVTRALDTILRNRQDGVLTLVLPQTDQPATDIEATRALAAAFADRLTAALLRGVLYLTRPTDYLLQFGPEQLTEVAVLLFSPNDPDQDEALRDFAGQLSANRVTIDLVAGTSPAWLPQDAGRIDFWPGTHPEGAPLPDVIVLTDPVPDGDLPPASVILHAGHARSGPTRLREDGRLHILTEEWPTLAARDWPALESVAVVIRPEDIATPVQRSEILRRLLSATRDGQTRFLKLRILADQLLAPDPVHQRLWATQRRQVSDPPSPALLSSSERTQLLEDAQVAWTYIDRFTSAETGLCAGTVQDGPVRRVNYEATFWDMASQMQGIVAAARLDLISASAARDRLALMLSHLPLMRLDGQDLPPAVFVTNKDNEVVRSSFDICDAGRFLIALQLAVQSGLLPEETASTLIDSWDLKSAVSDGRPYNHDGRRWRDTSLSHCTPYIAPAFEDLNLPLTATYPPLPELPSADSRMDLLYAVATKGSYGTEPLLLQAIERGATPESSFLTDVLFDAQLSWFEDTGRLKCVSEIPLNVAPWFTYQGLRVDRTGAESWTILSPRDNDAFQSEEFQKRIELLSSKSAYLWAAVYPHPHSTRLLDLIRDKARIDGFGSSVGVYTETLLSMTNYSDLNTNGVILAAIARMLTQDAPEE